MAGKSKGKKQTDKSEGAPEVSDTKSDSSSLSEDIETLKRDLEAKEAEISELKEQLLRNRAEFDNFRKRSRREMEEFRKFAVENVMFELLEVYDNFERALASCRNTDDVDNIIAGVNMVFKQFVSILEKEGLKRIECEGKEFDPQLHEAALHVENDEYPDNTVIEVCRPGYEFHSKVIRPASVIVSKNVSKQN